MLASGAKNRVDDDNYETCPQDIRIMLSECKTSDVICDPFVCNGFSQTYIKHLGYETREFDADFFESKTLPEGVTMIVTNPPFSKKQHILKHLLELDADFVLMLPMTIITCNYFTYAVQSTAHTHQWKILLPSKVVKYHKKGRIDKRPPFNSMFVVRKRRSRPLRNQSIASTDVRMLDYHDQPPFHVDGEHIGEDKE